MKLNDLLKRVLQAFNVIPNTRFFYDDKKTSTYEIASEIEEYLLEVSPNIFAKIDWGLLEKQKATLAVLQVKEITQQEKEAIEGVLNLLDAIQDYAEDVLGIIVTTEHLTKK